MTIDKELPERINGRLYFRIGDRLVPAIYGAAGEKPAPTDDDAEKPMSRDEISQLVNQAVSSHTKRLQTSLEKSFADSIAKALEAKKPTEEPEEKPAKGDKVDPKEKARDKEFAELKRLIEEERTARLNVERESRQNKTEGQLRQFLEGANVRKEMLDLAVGHLAKLTGALSYDDDGKPSLSVRRARTKGATPEDMSFEDLKLGVEDWAKTEEAAVFLQPPNTGSNRNRNSNAPFSPNGTSRPKADPLGDLLDGMARDAAGSSTE